MINEYLFDKTPRLQNGVKVRVDGNGDGWSNAHRGLGNNIFMQDVDASFGFMTFGHNTGESLFLEFVPDDYRKNRDRVIRNFGVVAMFDRKRTEAKAFDNSSVLSRAVYLWQCRVFSANQPVQAKFYYVIGSNEPPWKMIELDIETGDRIGIDRVIGSTGSVEWTELWQELGLFNIRREIGRWLAG